MDVHSQEQRSRNMAAIKGQNTNPEMVVRRLAHRMGFRYRLHDKKLPGKPDLVFPRLKKIIMVHGCFWHIHDCKYGSVVPKTRAEFWKTKRQSNVDRDKDVLIQLESLGWKVLVIWECQIKDAKTAENILQKFLNN